MGDLCKKIISFANKEFNQPYSLELKRPSKVIRREEDLFERPRELYDRADDNPDMPGYLLKSENRKRFAYMLERDQ